MKKIFVDGSAGTTGLRIIERLSARDDIELLILPEEKRKDINSRQEMLNASDITFLCLPDEVAIEAVGLLKNDNTVIIDTSTAHRTNPDWAYGFPELDTCFEERIKNSRLISVPGCHASGFIALIYPLISEGIISKDALLSCYSITGYSGGGKQMIAEYEKENLPDDFKAPRTYALTQQHKHLKEMKVITNLENQPVFVPIVSNFYSGMYVSIPLFATQINGSVEKIKNIYAKKYKSGIVKYKNDLDKNGFVSANDLSFNDGMEIAVFGNEERFTLNARYDNLGKGASGAAIECLNIILGNDKGKGLNL